MPKSFEEIDRVKARGAIAANVETAFKSREEIVAEQDARNEEARAAFEAQHEAVFGGAGAIMGVTEMGGTVADGSPKASAKKAAAKK
jgi:hypothetical protein